MTVLTDSYNNVKGSLRPQVQGTCGIYSFYNAVRILRDINARNPTVPAPKKSEKLPSDAPGSLRHYSKAHLNSGQGEILTGTEMVTLIATHRYAPLNFSRSGAVNAAAKKIFLSRCMKSGYPVLVAYIAGGTPVVCKDTTAADTGAHWSLIIDTNATHATVVEPNAPTVAKVWPLDDLLLSNSKTDDGKFVRYWAKQVFHPGEYDRQMGTCGPKATTPKVHATRGIDAIGSSAAGFAPSWNPRTGGKVGVYDIGGATGTRHTDQDLNNVLIAIIPPNGAKV